jgi:glutaredoxin
VVYGDKPPPSGKIQKTLVIVDAPVSPLPESVLKYQADLRKGMKKRLAEVAAGPLSIALLFTTKTCGYCRQAKVYLGTKGIAYQEHDIETPDGLRTFVAAGGGRKGVPVLVQNDNRIVGYSRPSYDAFFRTKKVNK